MTWHVAKGRKNPTGFSTIFSDLGLDYVFTSGCEVPSPIFEANKLAEVVIILTKGLGGRWRNIDIGIFLSYLGQSTKICTTKMERVLRRFT